MINLPESSKFNEFVYIVRIIIISMWCVYIAYYVYDIAFIIIIML
jgi:hypothetical protein